MSVSLARPGDDDVGQFTGDRGVSGVAGVYEGDAVLEIERVDDVAFALMQVDRARVHRRGRLHDAGAAKQSTGLGLQDRDLPAGGSADVGCRVRIDPRRGEVAAGASAEEPVIDKRVRHRLGIPHPNLGLGERKFGCRAEQLRPEDIRVRGIDHDALDRFVQQSRGVMDEVGVQRVVPGDQQDQRALSAAT